MKITKREAKLAWENSCNPKLTEQKIVEIRSRERNANLQRGYNVTTMKEYIEVIAD